MRFSSKNWPRKNWLRTNWLRVAGLLCGVAFLGACCSVPPLPWPEPEPDAPPVLDRDTDGITQHWNESRQWPSYNRHR